MINPQNALVKYYARLVMRGTYNISAVPVQYQEEVNKIIKEKAKELPKEEIKKEEPKKEKTKVAPKIIDITKPNKKKEPVKTIIEVKQEEVKIEEKKVIEEPAVKETPIVKTPRPVVKKGGSLKRTKK